jgi:MarR family 2-MHQ and catechol resistance regulon transcriptional repressor
MPNLNRMMLTDAERAQRIQDTSGVHVWLVLAQASQGLSAHAQQSLNLSRAGLGESDVRVREVLLHKGPLPRLSLTPHDRA